MLSAAYGVIKELLYLFFFVCFIVVSWAGVGCVIFSYRLPKSCLYLVVFLARVQCKEVIYM